MREARNPNPAIAGVVAAVAAAAFAGTYFFDPVPPGLPGLGAAVPGAVEPPGPAPVRSRYPHTRRFGQGSHHDPLATVPLIATCLGNHNECDPAQHRQDADA